jgi:peptidoglycan/LPS O-acetylase OafA/YrhL
LFKPANKTIFLLKVFTAYLLVFLLARFINAFHPINGADQDAGIRKVVVFRLDAVMYGVLFAYLNYFKRDVLLRMKNVLLAICIPGMLLVWYLMKNYPADLFASADPTARFLSDAFLYAVIPLLFSLCLPFASNIKSISGKLPAAIVTHISKISYSMYLVHYSLIFIPFFYRLELTATSTVIVLYALYWIVVIVLSSLIYRFYERPVMLLRDRFSR